MFRVISGILLIGIVLIILSGYALAWTVSGGNFGYRYPNDFTPNSVTCSMYSVNDTGGIDNNCYWVFGCGDGNYTYSTASGPSGNITFADGSQNLMYWENNSAPGTGYSPVTGWEIANRVYVYHMENVSVPVHDSVGNKDLDIVGTPILEEGVFGNAIRFDGSTDRLKNSTVNGTLCQRGCSIFLFGKIYAYNDNWDRYNTYGIPSSNKAINLCAEKFDVRNITISEYGGAFLISDVETQIGEWYCIVGISNSTGIYLWVNKIYKGAIATTLSMDAVTNNTIGSRGDTANWLNGSVDEYQVREGSATPEEIAYYCDNGFDALMALGSEEVDAADAPPTVDLDYPADAVWNTTTGDTYFNCSCVDDQDVGNISLFGNWSGDWALEATHDCSGVNTYCENKFTETISDGVYVWNCLCMDNASQTDVATNWTYLRDVTPPVINIDTVINGNTYNLSTPDVMGTIPEDTSGIVNITINSTVWAQIVMEMLTWGNNETDYHDHFFRSNSTDGMNFTNETMVYAGLEAGNETVVEYPNSYFNASGNGDIDVWYMGGDSKRNALYMNCTGDWSACDRAPEPILHRNYNNGPPGWDLFDGIFVIPKNATHWYLAASNYTNIAHSVGTALWVFPYADRADRTAYKYVGLILPPNRPGFCDGHANKGILMLRGINVSADGVYHMFPTGSNGTNLVICYFNTTNLEDNETFQFWDGVVIDVGNGNYDTVENGNAWVEYFSPEDRYFAYTTAKNGSGARVNHVAAFWCEPGDFPCLDGWTVDPENPKIWADASVYYKSFTVGTSTVLQRPGNPAVFTSSPFNWTANYNTTIGVEFHGSVTAWDVAGNVNTTLFYFTFDPSFGGNTPPTAPTDLTLTPHSVIPQDNLTANASGSTDADGDSLTYYYEFSDMNGTILQASSTTNWYVIPDYLEQHTIRVNATAYDGYDHSNVTNQTMAIAWINITNPVPGEEYYGPNKTTAFTFYVENNLTCFERIDNTTYALGTISGNQSNVRVINYGNHSYLAWCVSMDNASINYTKNVSSFSNIYGIWNITIMTENDWDEPLNITDANLSVIITCDGGETYVYNFSGIVLENVKPPCEVQTITVKFDYATDSFTRERVPPDCFECEVPMYMVDAMVYTVLQIPIYMSDVNYYDAMIEVYKTSGGSHYTITQGYFDIEHKYVTYLTKDNTYYIRITQAGEIRDIGHLYAASATAQYISLSHISLVPDITLIHDTITMAAEFDNVSAPTSTLRVQYLDLLNMTESVRIRIFQDTNQTAFFDNTYTGTSNFTIAINDVNTSFRYSVNFLVSHSVLGNSPISFTIGVGIASMLAGLGFSEALNWLYSGFAFFIILVTAFVIVPENRLPGYLILMVEIGILSYIQWFAFSGSQLALFIAFPVAGIIYEIKTQKGVS